MKNPLPNETGCPWESSIVRSTTEARARRKISVGVSGSNALGGGDDVNCSGVGGATAPGVAERISGFGADKGVVAGLAVATDVERTTFARPTVIVQAECSGWGLVYLKRPMYSWLDDCS